MFFLRHGEKAPLVISPTFLPSGVSTCGQAGQQEAAGQGDEVPARRQSIHTPAGSYRQGPAERPSAQSTMRAPQPGPAAPTRPPHSREQDAAAAAAKRTRQPTSEPWRAGAPELTKPTRRMVTPSASCCLMTCGRAGRGGRGGEGAGWRGVQPAIPVYKWAGRAPRPTRRLATAGEHARHSSCKRRPPGRPGS